MGFPLIYILNELQKLIMQGSLLVDMLMNIQCILYGTLNKKRIKTFPTCTDNPIDTIGSMKLSKFTKKKTNDLCIYHC